MKPLYLIIGFFMCFLAGAFLYLWGMNRQKRKTGDLMNLLFANGGDRYQRLHKAAAELHGENRSVNGRKRNLHSRPEITGRTLIKM